MQASIIIPTHNRAKILLFCLEALSMLDTVPETFEIIVVDNNSTDNTRDVCLNFAGSNPQLNLRYVFEKRQGVSHARNRGVAEAFSELICFLDDDSPPTQEWLKFLLKPFNDPKVGCVGGPSIPDFQGQQVPFWLQGDLQGLLSGYRLPYTKPTPISRWDQFPLSCNMAIRRSIFSDLGCFRTDLDRSGGQVLAAGDTEMADRIYRAGWKVIYVPYAPVRHLVPPERLTKEHIYRIGRGLAESHIILTSDPRPRLVVRWFASDLWYATRMFFGFVIAIIQRKPLWFDDYMRFWMVAMRLPIRLRVILRGSA
jgi:GT2 family glycosyltransferase